MATQSTEIENERYRKGLCISCGTAPHSAGRPRCNECHRAQPNIEPKLKRDPRRRRGRW